MSEGEKEESRDGVGGAECPCIAVARAISPGQFDRLGGTYYLSFEIEGGHARVRSGPSQMFDLARGQIAAVHAFATTRPATESTGDSATLDR